MSYKAWYNQDADYNTNARSYMDYLARHNKFMKVLVDDYEVFKEIMVEEFKQFQLDTGETIESFQSRLDNIQQEMTDLFIDWLEDGTLETIINENIFNGKADKEQIDLLYEKLHTLSKHTNQQIKATEFFTNEELEDIKLEEPLLDHSVKVQQAIDYLYSNDLNVLFFPEGNYRLKNLDLQGSNWKIYGEPIKNTLKLKSKISVIQGKDNTLFKGSCQFFDMSYLSIISEGTKTDTLNMSVFNNPSLNGTFVNVEYVYIENFSASSLVFRDLIDSSFTKVDMHNNRVGLEIISDNPFWDRTTTVTFNKMYSQHNDIALKANNCGQSTIVDCIYEYNGKAFELNDSQITFINLYLENNNEKSQALNSKLVEINTFVFGTSDGIDNTQTGMNPFNDGRVKINHRSVESKETITEYTKAKNTIMGNNLSKRWVLIGEFERDIAGSHIKLEILGSDSWGQSSTIETDGNVCKTTLVIESGASGNESIANTSSYFYHDGVNPAITRFRVQHENEYRTKIKIYGYVEQYARAFVKVDIHNGWFKFKGTDEIPSLTNDGMGGEVTNSKRILAKDLYYIQTDKLRLTIPVETGGVIPSNAINYLKITVNDTEYKIPLIQ